MHVKTRRGHCPRLKGWNSTLRFSWTYAKHRSVFDLLSILNKSTSTYFGLVQHLDNSTSTYSSACFVLFHQGGAKISPKCRLIRTYSRLMSTYSKRSAKQISNLSIVGEDGSSMHVKTRHGQCPRLKGSNSTFRFSWTYAQHRFVFDLLSILN